MLLMLLAASIPPFAQAHKSSDSYLNLRVAEGRLSGQWDIALRDLEPAIGLDENDDGVITWGELRARWPALDAYALARLRIDAGKGAVTMRVTEHLVDHHTDGAYAVIRFVADDYLGSDHLDLGYSLLFDLDPQHRGLLRLELPGGTQTVVFSPDHPSERFQLGQLRPLHQFFSFATEGVWHIWTGFDHILFLLALLLPAVFSRTEDQWIPAARFRPAVINVIRVVTAFTIAHSLTLSLATMGWVRLPSRWVESAVAASVVAAALNNLRPFFRERAWLVAFVFGLVHGFAFAGVLRDLGLEGGALARALVGFNLGVETGQLAIVSSFLPIAFALRTSWVYRRLTFQFGSAAIALVAAVWFTERAFDLKWLPF